MLTQRTAVSKAGVKFPRATSLRDDFKPEPFINDLYYSENVKGRVFVVSTYDSAAAIMNVLNLQL